MTTCTWEQVPHLSTKAKVDLLASIPPYQRDARSKGIPSLGAGSILPIPDEDIVIDDFRIPDHYSRAYGFDPGWNRNAVVWGAKDRNSGVIYLYSEHYQGSAEPSVHAQAIKSRGAWIPGVIDPASNGRSQIDGRALLQIYRDLGLDIQLANNEVEAGILNVWQHLAGGQLKVFRSLRYWFAEKRLYRRDEKGRPIRPTLAGLYTGQDASMSQVGDHLMAATRYLIQSGIDRMRTKPVAQPTPRSRAGGDERSWMA